MPSFPPEIFNEIFSHFHGRNDKATLNTTLEVSMPFTLLSRERSLTHIVFHGLSHILEFFALASTRSTSIPSLVYCDSVTVKGTETIDEASLPSVCALLGRLQLERTLGFHVIVGGIPPAVAAISAVWGNTLRQLSVRGGTHSPPSFFALLASLPRLESLALRDVKLDATSSTASQYTFPPSMTQLSLAHCATLWTFFRSNLLPGGGLSKIQDLYIQEVFFGGDEGIQDMRECFRRLPAVSTIILDPVHRDDRHPNFNCGPLDILRRCWEATFLKMQGLSLLRLNCTNLPAKFATEYVCMYAIQLSRLCVETIVEVYIPHTLDLSVPSACEELLDAADGTDLPAAVSGRSNLVIRGLPGRLPGGANRDQRVAVCEYPVTFRVTDWEEAIGARLDGL